tara:strand:- start:56 stop:1522 length:1467 start_codon:yes stop_codon:yes gene_type:complete
MKIYQQEIKDGLEEIVRSQASVAFASVAIPNSQPEQNDVIKKILASEGKSNPDQFDLYYLEAVLVSTGWNKNDDVFTPEATWAARSTPEDKQFNFMHNENDIIGHITSSYVLDKDGNKISADEAESPKDFDIVTEAVLYNSWTDPENRERMNKIIAEIEEGKWFVSMECLFSDFDYALVDPDGKNHVVARTEESSFLTKHLRSYGGEGKYENYTVGRALKNIAFSGKGLVAKPANPRSVIFEKSKSFIINEDVTDKLSIGEIIMSDNTQILEKQLASLKEDLAASKAENEAIKAQIEEAKDKEFASTVEAFEADVQAKDEAIANLEETVKSTQARIAELEDALQSSQSELAEAMKDMEDMKKKEKMEKRKAALIEAGISEEEVEESLASFDALEDEAFDSIVALMKPKKKDEEKEEEARVKPKASEEEAEEAEAEEQAEEDSEEAEAELEEAFEEVETTEAALVEAEEEVNSTKAAVADWLSNNVFSK